MDNKQMITKKTWNEFYETGLLWFINTILHAFGWSIVMELDNDSVVKCYPARVRFRGFDKGHNDIGYRSINQYMRNYGEQLFKEADEEFVKEYGE